MGQATEMVVVGCRIPQGMILHHPADRTITAKLAGPMVVMTDPRKMGLNFGLTKVPADLWAAWRKAYADNPIVVSKAVFEAKKEEDAIAKGKELQSEKTGFEQMPQNTLGVEKSKDSD